MSGQADWSEVPAKVSSSFATFRELFRGAHEKMLGITILGDSQETVSGGGGKTYVPAFNQQFFQHYGNIPKSGIASSSSYPDGWMLAGNSAGVTSTELCLPALSLGQYDGSAYGLLAQFVSDSSNKPLFFLADGGYFHGNAVTPELILRTRPGSSEVNWRVNVNETDTKTYFGGTDVASGTTSLGLDRTEIVYVTQSLGTYDLGTHKALQVIAHGDSSEASADIVGVRFVNSQDSTGVAVQSFSKGGNKASYFLNEYEFAEQVFRAVVGDDIIAIQYGANDLRDRTATQFKSDLESLIARVRDWSDNPELPILLIADPDRGDLSAPQRTEFDKYPGVAAEIAMELPDVLALNTRLLCAAHGWVFGLPEFDLFTGDQVHYTEYGALSLAKWQVESLLELDVPNNVRGDANGDGKFDFGDIDALFLAVTDPLAYTAQYSEVEILLLDMNDDGDTNFGDIEPFFIELTGN